MNILLVEDNPDILELTKISLEMIGSHKVDTAEDGYLALQKILNQKYDLILLDDMLPELNGFQVYQAYAKQATSPTPIIFFTANTNKAELKIVNNIVLGLITKPFDPKALCQSIESLVNAFKIKNKKAS